MTAGAEGGGILQGPTGLEEKSGLILNGKSS